MFGTANQLGIATMMRDSSAVSWTEMARQVAAEIRGQNNLLQVGFAIRCELLFEVVHDVWIRDVV